MRIHNKHKEFLLESNAIEGVYDNLSYIQAFEAWEYLLGQKELTVDVILETHKILMAHTKLKADEKGQLRRCEVRIGRSYGIPYRDVRIALESWVSGIKDSIKIPGKAGINIKIDHVAYEKIHPFVDGNGRTGRMFYNWMRLKAKLPIHVIHEGQEQMEYYKWFQ